MSDYLNITEASEYLNVSPKTLRRWGKRGLISAKRTKGGHRRYGISELNLIKYKPHYRNKLLTITEAANYLNLNPETLRIWESKGTLLPKRTEGGHRRYDLVDLEQFKSKQQKAVISNKSTRIITQQEIDRSAKERNRDMIQPVRPSDIPVIYTHAFTAFQRKLFKLSAGIALISLGLILGTKFVLSANFAFINELNSKLQYIGLIPTAVQQDDTVSSKKIADFINEANTKKGEVLAANVSITDLSYDVNIPSNFSAAASFTNNIIVDDSVDTTSDIFNLLNTTATTLNIGGESTEVNLGALGGIVNIGGSLAFEGATNDGNVTTFIITDPTIDHTVTFPNATGEVSLLGQTIDSAELVDATITETDLNVTNDPTDNYVLSYDLATGTFTWVAQTTDTNTDTNYWTDGGAITYLTSTTDDLALGGSTSSAPFFYDESAELLTLTNTTSGVSFRVNDESSDSTPFVIDASGNIGIGTSAPTYPVEVQFAGFGSGQGTFRVSNTSQGIVIAEDTLRVEHFESSNYFDLKHDGIGTLKFTYDGSEKMRLDGINSRLGIGNSSPQSLTHIGSAGTPSTIDGTDDLYVYDDIEVGGNIYGTLLYQGGNQVCDTSGNCSGTTSYWAAANGTLYEFTSTRDLLLGGTATTSAKFGFLNVNSGTPTASVAGSTTGNSLYLTGDGKIATTNKLNISLGDANSGNIVVPNGNVGIGDTSPSALLTVGDDTGMNIVDGTNDVYILDDLEVDGSIYQAGNQVCDTGGNCTGVTGYWNLTAGSLTPKFSTNDLLIGGTSTASARVIAGGSLTRGLASLIVNQTELQDIFTASQSGVARYAINSTGNITYSPAAFGSAITLYASDTSFTSGDTGIVDAINVAYSAGTGGSGGLWTDGTTIVYPTDTTDDLAIGGTSLASSIFSIDESDGIFLFGGDQSANPILRFEATDSDTADFGFNTSDSFYITGGRLGVGTSAPSSIIDSLSNSTPQLRLSYDATHYASFQTNSNGDLFLTMTTGGAFAEQLVFADTNTFSVGGAGAFNANYNAIAGSVTGAGLVSDDNDLYIEDDLEVDGSIYQGNNQVCDLSGNCAGTTSFWAASGNGTLYELTNKRDILIGSSATASAKFGFLNVAGGTPTASIAGSTTGNSLYLTGDGKIATTNKLNISLGDASSGNVTIPSGYLGIGISPSYPLHNNKTFTSGSFQYGLYNNITADYSSGGNVWGIQSFASVPSSNSSSSLGSLTGSRLNTTHSGTGLVADVAGTASYTSISGAGSATTLQGNINSTSVLGTNQSPSVTTIKGFTNSVSVGNFGGGISTVTDAYGIYSQVGAQYRISGTPALTNSYNLYLNNFDPDSNYTLYNSTNNYQLYIESPTVGSSLNYSIYSAGGDNYFAGNLGLGDATPQALLSVGDDTGMNIVDGTNDAYILDDLEVDGSIYQAGNQVCDTGGNCVGTTSFWQLNSGTLSPFSLTADVNFGATATASAKVSIAGSLTRGLSALMVNQTESEDILTASASGTTRFRLTNGGLIERAGARATGNSYTVYVDGSNYGALSNDGGTHYFGTNIVTIIESIVADLDSAGGGSVFFQKGTFDMGTSNFTCNAQDNIEFAGQGIDATIIQNSTDAASDTEPLSYTNCKSWTIRDMTVSAGGTARSSSDAIDFDQGDDVLIERVKITASRSRGIVFDGKDTTGTGTADRNIIRNNIITGTQGTTGDGIELLASSRNLVEGNKIYDVTGAGIQITKASSGASQANKKAVYNSIIGNDLYNSGRDGIDILSSDYNTISGNTILNSADDTASRDGIRIETSDSITADYNILTNNIITDDQGVKTQRYGINISATSNGTTISNNYLDGNLTSNLNDAGTNTRYNQYLSSDNILGVSGNVGIGLVSPAAKLEVQTGSTDAVTGLLVDQQDLDQIGAQIANAASATATLLDLDSQSISGDVFNLDWQASTQTGALTGLDVDLTNLTDDNTNTIYGVHVNDFNNAGGGAGTQYGLYVEGTNWDYGIFSADDIGLAASSYLNWGTTAGTSGYGFRDNSGAIEYKDSGGSWIALNSIGGGTNYWQLNSGALSPFSLTADVNFGATATASAKVSIAGSLAKGQAALIVNQTEAVQDIFTASDSGTARFTIAQDGSIAQTSADTTTSAYTFLGDSITSGTAFDLSLDSLQNGKGLYIESTSTGLTSGSLASLYWNPSGATEIYATGDLFKIDVGQYGNVGNILALYDNGSEVFSVDQAKITSALPHEFTAAGDVSVAYDLQFTNQTASYIKSNAPLYLQAGESFENNNLALQTYGTGKISVEPQGTGYLHVYQPSTSITGTTTTNLNVAGQYVQTADADTISLLVRNDSSSLDMADVGTAGTQGDPGVLTIEVNGGTTTNYNLITAYNATTRSDAAAVFRVQGDGTVYGEATFQTSGADVAEYFPKETALNPGDLAGLNPASGKVRMYQSGDAMIGVVSLTPGFVGNRPKGLSEEEINNQYAVVGLLGQMQVKASNVNGQINAGDPLAPSQIPGVVVKATGKGKIVGHALASLINGNESVLAYVNSSWYDPNSNSQFSNTNFQTDTSIENLVVSGDAVLGDVTISGDLSVGGISFDGVNNSIDAIGTLSIQPLALGNVEFMGGLITFDTEGNITANEITADKYKVAGASAGSSRINIGDTSVFVATGAVTNDSLIFITPKTVTGRQLSVTTKQEGNGFRVEMGGTETQDIEFDWWIVDKVE